MRWHIQRWCSRSRAKHMSLAVMRHHHTHSHAARMLLRVVCESNDRRRRRVQRTKLAELFVIRNGHWCGAHFRNSQKKKKQTHKRRATARYNLTMGVCVRLVCLWMCNCVCKRARQNTWTSITAYGQRTSEGKTTKEHFSRNKRLSILSLLFLLLSSPFSIADMNMRHFGNTILIIDLSADPFCFRLSTIFYCCIQWRCTAQIDACVSLLFMLHYLPSFVLPPCANQAKRQRMLNGECIHCSCSVSRSEIRKFQSASCSSDCAAFRSATLMDIKYPF